MARAGWLQCVTEASSATCAVYTEDCEGWWLSGSVAEHWLHKPLSWVRLPVTAILFVFLYFVS